MSDMQADGLIAAAARPGEDGQVAIDCEPMLAAWCRARAYAYRNEDLDRAFAFIVAAETIEAALGLRPPSTPPDST